MKLYLDTSALKRPFDDQFQPRIALETEAVVTVLAMIQGREASLMTSSILEYENSRNPQMERRRWTSQVLHLAISRQSLTAATQHRAATLESQGLKPLDALHVACAEMGHADQFLTCDDHLLRHYRGTLSVLNQVQFILNLSKKS